VVGAIDDTVITDWDDSLTVPLRDCFKGASPFRVEKNGNARCDEGIDSVYLLGWEMSGSVPQLTGEVSAGTCADLGSGYDLELETDLDRQGILYLHCLLEDGQPVGPRSGRELSLFQAGLVQPDHHYEIRFAPNGSVCYDGRPLQWRSVSFTGVADRNRVTLAVEHSVPSPPCPWIL